MDLDLSSLRMPDRLGVNYDEHITKHTEPHETQEVRIGKRNPQPTKPEPRPDPVQV